MSTTMEQFVNYAPLPPLENTVMSETIDWNFLYVSCVLGVASLIYAAYAANRNKSFLPIACMIGGALTLFLEPLVDSHLHVWWSINYQPDIINAWGRDVPLMLLPLLIFYFGVGALLRLDILERKGAASPLWAIYCIEVLMAYMIEPLAVYFDEWHYYGEQGPRLFGYPMWWPMVGGACGCFAGTLLYVLKPYMTGYRQLLAILLVPMAVAAVYWAAAWPMFFALNKEPATWVIYACAALSVGQALLIVWMCTILTGHHAYMRNKKGLPPIQPVGSPIAQ